MDFLHGIVFDAETQREVASEPVQRLRLYARGTPHAEGVAYHDEGKKEGNDEKVGKTFGQGDGGADGYGHGRMAGGHAAGSPEEYQKRFAETFPPGFEQGYGGLDELRDKKAEKSREKNGIAKESPDIVCVVSHRPRSFPLLPHHVKPWREASRSFLLIGPG